MNRRFLFKTAILAVEIFLISSISLAAQPFNRQNAVNYLTPTHSTDKPVLPFVPGSWTIVILPDTQKYTQDYPGILNLQLQWIKENKRKYNIRYALQSGDLVNDNNDRQWQRASDAFARIDGVVPYAISLGNHDYAQKREKVGNRWRIDMTRESTLVNKYFPVSRFKKWPTFGGVMEKGHVENNYQIFKADKNKWLIICLEWAPRGEALEWAGKILDKYSDHRAIILTHAYLYSDSTRYDWKAKGYKQHYNPHITNIDSSQNDGEEIWQKLIRKHPNVIITVNGHVVGPDETGKITEKSKGWGFLVSQTDQNTPVFQILTDFQMLQSGGGGWLNLMEFLPDGQTVQFKTYSPLYELYDTGDELQFSFKMPLDIVPKKDIN